MLHLRCVLLLLCAGLRPAGAVRKRELSRLGSGEEAQQVVSKLWDVDAPYRLEPGTDFVLDPQSRAASVESGDDRSRKPMFSYVDEEKLMRGPCAGAFMALLDNFERDISKGEVETPETLAEIQTFMTELMATDHMRVIFDALAAEGAFTGDYTAFGKKVEEIWFTQYSVSRGGPLASSGFEHVFVGEEKYDRRDGRSEITGFHNWIQFWREEQAGRLNYLGYIQKPQDNSHIVLCRFAWEDEDAEVEVKSVTSVLVGGSVPFEMAVLSYAFLANGGEAKVPGIFFGQEGPTELTAYGWNTRQGRVIRTAYVAA